MKIEIDLKDFGNFISGLKILSRHVEEINRERAERFKRYTKGNVRKNRVLLKENSPATVKIQGTRHRPLRFSGEMLDNLKCEHKKEASIVRFSNKKIRDGDITYEKLAALQESGFRIPLQGSKGNNVRKFLAAHGIYVKKSKQFLVVPPRPFFKRTIELYLAAEFDKHIIGKFWRKYVSRIK